ncbi:MAG: PIG-L deacetylase family protein [Bacillota bacterium]
MLARVKQLVRRRLRGMQWSGCYPIVLPHVWLSDVDGSVALCDGTRTMRQVSQKGGLPLEQIIGWHDEELIVIWPKALVHGPLVQDDRPRTVVVSPHPDDAAFSVGGMMLRQAATSRVVVLDVFTHTAWWRYGEPDPDRVVAMRYAEEKLMSRLAGVELRMLGLPEALLRGYELGQVFAAQPGKADLRVAAEIGATVRTLAAEWPGAQWWLPMGIGGHLDHRLVRDTAANALQTAGVTGVRFYEDQPYAAEGCNLVDSGNWAGRPRVSLDVDISGWLRWKLELCRVYASQITWPRIRSLGGYARRIGRGRAVERLWGSGA